MKANVFVSVTLAIAPALCVAGCGGGGGGGSGGFADATPFLSASAQGIDPAAALAMYATLNAMDPTNHPPLQGSSPQVSIDGTVDAGTVTLDFGNGTIVNNATWRGEIVVTYASVVRNGSSGSANLQIDMDRFEFSTNWAGNVTVNGTVTLLGFGWSASSAGASGSSTLDVNLGGTSYDLTVMAFAWTFDAAGPERIEYTQVDDYDDLGTTGVMIETADLEMTFVGGNRAIVSGDAVGQRGVIAQLLEFEGPNSGTMITAPPGVISSFSF